MNFSDALTALKAGSKLARSGWDSKTTWIFLVAAGARLATQGEPSLITAAFIAMQTTQGPIIPWTPSPNDLLAENWGLVA